ncbi:MAG: J domain-containing protein [Rhodospirillaceae bacterium]|nr:J domain-containing protein [Rhodospirillaceae bacterium]
MRDPYDTLGVPRNATADVIKKAYRNLARQHHPDSSPDNPKSEDRFKDLSTAYDILSDAKKRSSYDRGEIDAMGNPVAGPRMHRAGRDAGQRRSRNPFDDFFKRRNSHRSSGLRVDGSDVSYSLKVDFLDAALGSNKTVSMTNGKRLAVSIPAGTKNAQVLRLKGQGMDGIGGGKSGDAHVEIIVKPDDLYLQEGDDIHMNLPISLPEAILGGIIEVPTIYGAVKLNIPAGSNTGTVMRLKGKGIENRKKQSKGNQYVTLQVVLPKKQDKELTGFVKKWANKNDYDVRGVGLKTKAD